MTAKKPEPKSHEVMCVGVVPVDLTGGRQLAPGERAVLADFGEHEEALVAAGVLKVVTPDSKGD